MTHDKLVLLVTQRVVAEKRMPRASDTMHVPVCEPALESLTDFIELGLDELESRFHGFITPRSQLAALRNSSERNG